MLNLKQRANLTTSPLCLGKISTDCSVDNMKDTGLNGYVYDFSIDYGVTSVSDEEKWNSIKMFKFIKQIFTSTIMLFVVY